MKMIITEVANCGGVGEKEILTRLEDEVISDEKWELKLFHVWTVPREGKVQYNFLVFYKGGVVYKSSVNVVFSKVGDSNIILLNKEQLEMLKLVCMKKLREDHPDIRVKMELPGGLDINRVTLPIILNTSSDVTNNNAAVHNKTTLQTSEKSKSKSNGILGFFKTSSSSPEPQVPNNLIKKDKKDDEIPLVDRAPKAPLSNTSKLPPPRIQKQNTIIDTEPKLIESMLSKDLTSDINVNNDNTKETLKVPVADLFPEKLSEQNYSRRKKSPAAGVSEKKSSSPVRKVSTCLEPHEPVIDSLPAPVPLSPSPRPSLTRNISICSNNSSFDAFSKQSGILGKYKAY